MKSEICIDTHIILFAKPVKFRGQNVLFSTFQQKFEKAKNNDFFGFSIQSDAHSFAVNKEYFIF